MLKKVSKILFVALILLILLAGLAQTLFFPNDINYYENRYAEKLQPFSVKAFLDGSLQDNMDAALSDQVHLSEYCKRIYNTVHSYLTEALLIPVAKMDPNRYIAFSDMQLFGGTHLTFYTRPVSFLAENLSLTADAYNRLLALYPDTEFYFYFIEKDTEINFATGERTGAYDYFRERVNIPDQKIDCFEVESFDVFNQYFYRTDHHWNYAGAYAGYQELLSLLNRSEPALQPQGTVVVSDSFSGSKANMAGATTMSETMTAYRFEFPPMTVTVNGQPAADYGAQDSFLNGTATAALSYGAFYGGDMGEVIFDTGTSGRGSLLVVGESFDNAVLKLLASHYDRTYSIDLRYYENYMGEKFHMGEYLSEHEITNVLFIGNIDFYVSDTFRLEG